MFLQYHDPKYNCSAKFSSDAFNSSSLFNLIQINFTISIPGMFCNKYILGVVEKIFLNTSFFKLIQNSPLMKPWMNLPVRLGKDSHKIRLQAFLECPVFSIRTYLCCFVVITVIATAKANDIYWDMKKQDIFEIYSWKVCTSMSVDARW